MHDNYYMTYYSLFRYLESKCIKGRKTFHLLFECLKLFIDSNCLSKRNSAKCLKCVTLQDNIDNLSYPSAILILRSILQCSPISLESSYLISYSSPMVFYLSVAFYHELKKFWLFFISKYKTLDRTWCSIM